MTTRLSDVIPDPLPCATYDNLPDVEALGELKRRDAWVAWKYDDRGGSKPTKVPVSPRTGFNASSTNPSTWGSYDAAVNRARASRLAGVGFMLAEDDGLTGIDLDGCIDLYTGDVEPWAQAVLDCAETYAERSPSGTGLRLWMRGKADRSFKGNQVEVYTRARYLTVTGWHVYGTPETINEAPHSMALLLARVPTPVAVERAPMPVLPRMGRHPYAEEALRQECSRVASAGDGTRNNTINEAAFNLGQLAPHALSEGEIADAIGSAAMACGLKPNDRVFGPRGTIARAIRDGMKSPRAIPERGQTEIDHDAIARFMATSDGHVVDPETGEVFEARVHGNPASPLAVVPLGRDVDWTRPSGLLSDMTDWILATSRRPNRPLAVAAAVAVVSAICGRHLYGPTSSALNLYIVTLADTAVGKGRPLAATYDLLKAAGLASLNDTLNAFSVSALQDLICDKPCVLATSDEIGVNLLKRISHSKGSTHETGMKGVILQLFSQDRGSPPYMTHRRAGKSSVEVHQPSLTIYGASTPEAFYESITESSVSDGFLNRFLIAHAGPRAKVQDVPDHLKTVPAAIAKRLAAIAPTPKGEIAGLTGVFYGTGAPESMRMPCTDEARDAHNAFEEAVLDATDGHPAPVRALSGRIAEYAIRLASIHAVSRGGRNATVTLGDLEWGASWARASAEIMIEGASRFMASSDYEAKLNTISKVIRDAGIIGKRELLRQVRSVSARDRDDILKHLAGSGMIQVAKIETTGRTADGFKWIG